MKAVMLSVQPKWCELIASGKKTVEIRKTKPKIGTPFKCYIYETKGRKKQFKYRDLSALDDDYRIGFDYEGRGQIIGEFVCDCITNYEAELWDDETYERIQEFFEPDDFAEYGEYEYQTLADNGDDFWKEQHLCKVSCVSIEELRKYLGLGIKEFYGWHISDLVIYDKPKELGDFKVRVTNKIWSFTKKLERPFQSWGYVEELKGGAE